MLMPHLGTFCALILLGVAIPASAQTAFEPAAHSAAARLDYAAPEMGTLCPTRESFEDIVAARLGYAPFSATAPMRVVARIERIQENLHANVEIHDASDAIVGSRDFDGAASECADLAQAMAVAISVSIDPLSLGGPAQVVAPHSETTTGPVQTPALEEPPLRYGATLDLIAAVQATPSFALGPRIGFVLRRSAFSLGLEAKLALQTSAWDTGIGANVHARLVSGSLVPCLNVSVAQVCGVASAGAFSADGTGLTTATNVVHAWAAVGARVGIEIPVTRLLSFRLNTDLAAVLLRTELAIDDVTVWTAPIFTLDVGIGMTLHFL